MISRRLAVSSLAALIAVLVLSAYGRCGGGDKFRRSREIHQPGAGSASRRRWSRRSSRVFTEDGFTFAQLIFHNYAGYRCGGGRLWDDDSPDADLTLTYRMFQLTSLTMRPGLNFIDITTKELERNPFVYVAAAGRMELADDEVSALRHYLLNGGFMMADDFWGDDQWHHFYDQMKRVFPEREPVLLTLEDRIFHNVFEFKLPQIPSVGTFLNYGMAYEPGASYVEQDHGPHYYGIYDDKHRMMVLVCHNNHFGDGWEHESDDERYFDIFSEPMGYPLFINILVYTTTH